MITYSHDSKEFVIDKLRYYEKSLVLYASNINT